MSELTNTEELWDEEESKRVYYNTLINLDRSAIKRTSLHMRTAKPLISLHIRALRQEYLLFDVSRTVIVLNDQYGCAGWSVTLSSSYATRMTYGSSR